MAKRTAPPGHPPPKTFEEALDELETILKEIESGEVGLEETLTKYERGNALIRHCRGVLNTAEKQIEALGRGDDGSLQSQPMSAPGGGAGGGGAGDDEA